MNTLRKELNRLEKEFKALLVKRDSEGLTEEELKLAIALQYKIACILSNDALDT